MLREVRNKDTRICAVHIKIHIPPVLYSTDGKSVFLFFHLFFYVYESTTNTTTTNDYFFQEEIDF